MDDLITCELRAAARLRESARPTRPMSPMVRLALTPSRHWANVGMRPIGMLRPPMPPMAPLALRPNPVAPSLQIRDSPRPAKLARTSRRSAPMIEDELDRARALHCWEQLAEELGVATAFGVAAEAMRPADRVQDLEDRMATKSTGTMMQRASAWRLFIKECASRGWNVPGMRSWPVQRRHRRDGVQIVRRGEVREIHWSAPM